MNFFLIFVLPSLIYVFFNHELHIFFRIVLFCFWYSFLFYVSVFFGFSLVITWMVMARPRWGGSTLSPPLSGCPWSFGLVFRS